jgi:hypothetical protein
MDLRILIPGKENVMTICGARSRRNNGAPCKGRPMANGRCRMHRGVASREETHGRATLRAKMQRKKESSFLKEMRSINQAIDELLKEKSNNSNIYNF